MTFISVPNTAKVVCRYDLNGQQVINVHHFSTVADFTLTDLLSLCDKVQSEHQLALLTYQSQKLTAIDTQAIDLRTQDGEVATLAWPPASNGSLAGTAMPGGVAAVVTMHTDLRGRSYRGRTYVAGLDNSVMLSNGTIGSTWLGHILAGFAELFTLSTTVPWLLSVVSYYLNKTQRSVGVSTPVQSMSMDSYIDSQRRRNIGRGA